MWKTIKKYAALHAAFFQASFAADIEYRFNFFLRIFSDMVWYAGQIVMFEVIFSKTPMIGSWNLEKTRVFLGLIFMTDALYMIFIQENLDRFADKVRRGDLDVVLAKPIHSQYMMSFQKVSTAFIVNFILGAGWFFWALKHSSQDVHFLRVLWLLMLMPAGLAVFYSLRFFFAAVAIITVRAENLQYLWYQLYRLGMRPDNIYHPWVKYFVLTLLPVGLVASVPARALLDPPNYGLFLWAIVAASSCVYATTRFWRYALTYYSSASS